MSSSSRPSACGLAARPLMRTVGEGAKPMSSSASRVMSPANLILPIKSGLKVAELDAIRHLKASKAIEAVDAIGTLHFARFVEFQDHNQLAFFSAFDGDLRTYIQDFARHIGSLFNLIFKDVVNAPPLPVEKNTEAFHDWVAANNLAYIGFYSAYPSLSVQDIRARAGVVQGGVDEGQSPLMLVLPVKSPTHLAALSQKLTEWLPK